MGFFSSPSETRNNPKPDSESTKAYKAAVKKQADREIRARLSRTRVTKSADGRFEIHTTER